VSGAVNAVDPSFTVPDGCSFDVAREFGVHMMIKNYIDVGKEVQKLTKNRDLIAKSIDSLKKKMQDKDYDTKVPENVRKANAEKLDSQLKELQQVDGAIVRMQKMSTTA